MTMTVTQCARRFVAGSLAVLALLLALAASAEAQRPSIRRYAVADGLPSNSVTAIFRDRKGHLWVATSEGLARFDGHRFVAYGTADGLAHSYVSAVAEDPHGHIWVGTGAGVSRLIDVEPGSGASASLPWPRYRTATTRTFVSLRVGATATSNFVNSLVFDRAGRLWCATDEGLYRAREPTGDPSSFDPVPEFERDTVVSVDTLGRLWTLGAGTRVARLDEGRVRAQPMALARGAIVSQGPSGRVWLVNGREVLEFVEPSDRNAFGSWQPVPIRVDVGQTAYGVGLDPHGTLWATTSQGLVRVREGQQTVYSTAHGLPADLNRAIVSDWRGHLWVGSRATGLYALSGDAIVNYTARDGLPGDSVASVFEAPDGRILARARDSDLVEIRPDRVVRLAGTSRLFETVHSKRRLGTIVQGTWWLLRTDGLCRLEEPDLRGHGQPACIRGEWQTPDSVVLTSDSMDIPDLHADPGGTLWFATTNALHRVAPGSHRPERVPLAFARPTLGLSPAVADAKGGLWLISANAIARWTDGVVEFIEPGDGLPETRPRSVLVDRLGRLWIGLRYGGVSMTPDPAATRPAFVNYNTRNGLASDSVWSITEDALGRIYFGTGRGLNRLDPSTGLFEHFTTADGLAGDLINQCLTDRTGHVWIATSTGLSRFDPRIDTSPGDRPRVFLYRVQAAGRDLLLPETGTAQVPLAHLPSTASSLLIEYGAPVADGRAVRYEYRLEGVDQGWSQPTQNRAVTYARLAPGAYRFAVRALAPSGARGEPAWMAFEIDAPFYRRTWFTAIVLVSLAAVAFSVHQMRVKRLLATERVRRQIAADLHDDVGAGLAQVAILSEVARRQAPPPAADLLGQIATLARSMRESMSDIVWAVDPTRERLADLVSRMRQAALQTLGADSIQVEFVAPADPAHDRIWLAPDRRRHLLLIFKEAVTNISRHAKATHVRIDVSIARGRFRMRIQDNGSGFDAGRPSDGHGLDSLRRRTSELAGTFRVDSQTGAGTTIEVDLPI